MAEAACLEGEEREEGTEEVGWATVEKAKEMAEAGFPETEAESEAGLETGVGSEGVEGTGEPEAAMAGEATSLRK